MNTMKESENHFHNMLKSGNQGEYQQGNVLDNLMTLGIPETQLSRNSKTQSSHPFGKPTESTTSKQQQAVFNFMNSNITKGEVGMSNQTMSGLNLNINPFEKHGSHIQQNSRHMSSNLLSRVTKRPNQQLSDKFEEF